MGYVKAIPRRRGIALKHIAEGQAVMCHKNDKPVADPFRSSHRLLYVLFLSEEPLLEVLLDDVSEGLLVNDAAVDKFSVCDDEERRECREVVD